jgi:hypothetical protein
MELVTRLLKYSDQFACNSTSQEALLGSHEEPKEE